MNFFNTDFLAFESSPVTLLGITCVVGVLVAMLSMGAGVRSLTTQSARADRAVVLSKGAPYVNASTFEHSQVATIAELPGVKVDANGRPLATGTRWVRAAGRKKIDNVRTNIPFFGVDQQFFKVFPEWVWGPGLLRCSKVCRM